MLRRSFLYTMRDWYTPCNHAPSVIGCKGSRDERVADAAAVGIAPEPSNAQDECKQQIGALPPSF